MRKVLAPVLTLFVCGCAYFNGVYNSKAAARSGDKFTSVGEPFSAAAAYRRSAAKAESVLKRHPKSRWRPDALFLAGRGFAMAGECAYGLRRLEEYLALTTEPETRRNRAEIARAACWMNGNQLTQAADALAPLLASKDTRTRDEAALWAGRAALQLGNPDRAQELLATVPGSAAVWEFLTAALARGDLATAESLMVSRARAGDWRSSVPQDVRALWDQGRPQAAIAIIDMYGRSRAPVPERVGLHFLASDLSASVGDTAQARRQAIAAQGLGVAATVDAEVRVRLVALRIREVDKLPDAEAAFARDTARTRGTALYNRTRDHLTRIRLFLSGLTQGGVGVYLAAEVARDSLHAYRLAHSMFRSIEDDFGDSPLAARALLAARKIVPESTAVYESRVQEKWPRSGAAVSLTDTDLSMTSLSGEDRRLAQAWDFVARQWADTLKARKTADSLAAVQAVRR